MVPRWVSFCVLDFAPILSCDFCKHLLLWGVSFEANSVGQIQRGGFWLSFTAYYKMGAVIHL